jgi:hypothetical protein
MPPKAYIRRFYEENGYPDETINADDDGGGDGGYSTGVGSSSKHNKSNSNILRRRARSSVSAAHAALPETPGEGVRSYKLHHYRASSLL